MKTKSIVVVLSILLVASSSISLAAGEGDVKSEGKGSIKQNTEQCGGQAGNQNGKRAGSQPGKNVRNSDGNRVTPKSTTTPSTSPSNSNSTTADQSVVISGGFDTDSVDHGRPVVLIAAALGVPTEVFREAFSGVTPAGNDRGPTSEEAQRNKSALMSVLAPYGITNERLDEVSNYYRYNGSRGETWNSTQATATAVITDGVLTGVTITNPGAGYTSNPTITVTGPNGKVTATATISYTESFSTNGSITAITLN